MKKNYTLKSFLFATAIVLSLSLKAEDTPISISAGEASIFSQNYNEGTAHAFTISGVGIEAGTQTFNSKSIPTANAQNTESSECGIPLGIPPVLNVAKPLPVWNFLGTLTSNKAATVDGSAYITINVTGDAVITSVSIVGKSSANNGQSQLTFASSKNTNGTGYANGAILTFWDIKCKYDVEGNQSFSTFSKADGIKSIKLAREKGLGGTNAANFDDLGAGGGTWIKEIIVTTEDNSIGTGIGIAEDDSFIMNLSDNQIHMSEPASQVSIYNISGQLVQTAGNIQALPLNTLPPGIYVVKATSATGKNIITKIAR